MSSKDDRSKDKRRNMKQHNHYQRRGTTTTSSSSPQTTAARSLVDIADSSDETRFARKQLAGWSARPSSLAPQKNRDLVDTLPPTDDTDDMEQMGLDGPPLDENARAQLRAGDYNQLSQFPSLGGGHFSFGSEKEWTHAAESPLKSANSYFTVNLSLLNSGLQTIPFYKRMDYPTSMFTRQQLQEQNEAAERAEKVYHQRVLRESNGASAGKSRPATAKAPATTMDLPAAATAAEPADELDELLALTNTQLAMPSMPMPLPMPMVQPATPSSAGKNEVEQWLDSVLDE